MPFIMPTVVNPGPERQTRQRLEGVLGCRLRCDSPVRAAAETCPPTARSDCPATAAPQRTASKHGVVVIAGTVTQAGT